MDSLPAGVHIYTAATIAFPIIAALIYIFSKEKPDTGLLTFLTITGAIFFIAIPYWALFFAVSALREIRNRVHKKDDAGAA